MADKQTAFCPNCQKPAIKEGNKIICEKCDATFTITKTGGAKVDEMGRIEKLEQEIDIIKEILSPGEPEPGEPEPGEPEPGEPEPGEPEPGEEW